MDVVSRYFGFHAIREILGYHEMPTKSQGKKSGYFFVFTVERGGISFLPSSVLFLLGNPFRFCIVFALHM